MLPLSARPITDLRRFLHAPRDSARFALRQRSVVSGRILKDRRRCHEAHAVFPIVTQAVNRYSLSTDPRRGGPQSLRMETCFQLAHKLLIENSVDELKDPLNAEIRDKLLFAIHTGDMIGIAQKNSDWRQHFFNPAVKLLRELPLLPVIGENEYTELTGGVDQSRLANFRGHLDYPGEPPLDWICATDPGCLSTYSPVSYYFDIGRSRFVIGDTRKDAAPSGYDTFIRARIDEIKDSPAFDWRFVFFHWPGYSHSDENEFTPWHAAPPSLSADAEVRDALFSAGSSLAINEKRVSSAA